VAPDEGHGFARPVNNMAMYMASEAFLARHLGGRAQAGGTPEVTARLAEITVDPKTVTLAPRLAAGGAPPVPGRDLEATTLRYAGTLAAGGRSMAMTVALAVAPHPAGGWAVTERATLPMGMGTVVDSTRLEGRTLVTLARTVQQGPMQIDVAFAANRAAGRMSSGGQERPIGADLGGQLFGDGAGAYLAIGRLPLADGYRTTIRNFDLQRARAVMRQVAVAGRESVTVPAGTFDAWKVEVSDDAGADRTTLWVARDSGLPVRIEAGPGQARVTLELAK
jgi:hypothetical protein